MSGRFRPCQLLQDPKTEWCSPSKGVYHKNEELTTIQVTCCIACDGFDWFSIVPSSWIMIPLHQIPSGNLTVCYWKWWFIVDLHIKKQWFSIVCCMFTRWYCFTDRFLAKSPGFFWLRSEMRPNEEIFAVFLGWESMKNCIVLIYPLVMTNITIENGNF